ncbi:kinase-like domain-containing protein [Gilbertella persicaria]|uniref:kinase-like domain-containing protein n=1 Tax=Gilbertella persicaria TaxID=101096 RepID=UPI0022205589|nr:kinase-like domain-containing protein [Gilbertella persicaria]KAI8087051.1 kinase-like domain-containing protein [Gilbertella persicaria]
MSKEHSTVPSTLDSIGDYIMSSTIGYGSTGQVKLGIHQWSGQKAAIKIIPRIQLYSSLKITQAVERELAILQLLHHPNLIELYQILQDNENIYFITEYVPGGELYYALSDKKNNGLSETEAKQLFSQIISALAWCHARHICHRDLKPENILLDQTKKKIKIADFGMAVMQSTTKLLKTSCGSPHYASPEVVRGIPYYGPAADVWSAGVILYVLLAGKLPFDDRHIGRLLGKIKRGRFRQLPDWVSSSAKDLVYRMLVVNPNKRISSNDILSHPWLLSFPLLKGEDTPSMSLSIHSFSFRCNPWHDSQLRSPSIYHSNDLDGPTRETLKVLWRDLSHEQILSALMEKAPNVQKLTFQLLQQRQKRRSAASMNTSHHDSKFAYCFHDDSRVLPPPRMENDVIPFCFIPTIMHTLVRYKPSVQTTRFHVTATRFSFSKKSSVRQTMTTLRSYLIYQYNKWLSKRKRQRRNDQVFSVHCVATSEYIAAGKLHYILSEVCFIRMMVN